MSREQPVLVVTADENFFAAVQTALKEGGTQKDIKCFHPNDASPFIAENDHVILDMSGLQSKEKKSHPALLAADGVWKRVLVVGAGSDSFIFHRTSPFRAADLDSIECALPAFLRIGRR
ncbi:hypothetical protein GW943_02160 [Candidatus Parcubacteria bacterium]|nr:hypothetical protein [Candidatus Parcubacteria bacterium]